MPVNDVMQLTLKGFFCMLSEMVTIYKLENGVKDDKPVGGDLGAVLASQLLPRRR